MITIWGSKSSGKTVFLTALYHAILRNDRGWRVQIADQHSTRFITERREELIDKQIFPENTNPEDRDRIFKFDIEIRKGLFKHEKLELEFLDPAGEIFEGTGTFSPEVKDLVFETIKKSQGLICLIDPERTNKKTNKDRYFKLLANNFTEMKAKFFPEGGYKRLPIKVAICITKMDQNKKFVHDPVSFDVGAFARELMGIDSFRVLINYLDRYKFFAVSSMGLNEQGQPNVFISEDGKLRPTGAPNPINVFEPIEWLK